jgi:hypothetical protein
MLNVGKDSIINAKYVLRDGTPEEIAAVKAGTGRVNTIARQIRDNIPPKERRIERRTIHSRRQETLQAKGQLWGQLRDALVNLTSLPDPAEIVPIARSMDKRAGHLVDARLLPSLQWLKGFAHEWSNRDTVAEREKSSASYHADTGTGD